MTIPPELCLCKFYQFIPINNRKRKGKEEERKEAADTMESLSFRIKPSHQIEKEIGQSREKGSAIGN